MGKEFELKFAATPAQQAQIAALYGPFSEIAMETTYYDTKTFDFSAQKMTLRRRYENGLSVCTLKAPLGANSRKEFEVEAEDILSAIPMLCKLSGWQELETLTNHGLIPLCGARFTRQAATLSLPDCTLELALDAGVLTAGERQIPLCEIEVELKSGAEEAAVAFARELSGNFHLQPQPKSKFARAMELAFQQTEGR